MKQIRTSQEAVIDAGHLLADVHHTAVAQDRYQDLHHYEGRHVIVHSETVGDTAVGAPPSADLLVKDIGEGAADMEEEKGVVMVDENHPIHLHIHRPLAHVRLEDTEDEVLPSPPEVVRRHEDLSLLDVKIHRHQTLCHALAR